MLYDIRNNIESVRKRIEYAAGMACRRTEDIRIVAITKTVGLEKITEAVNCGIDTFGENYIQEAREKISNLRFQASNPKIKWHLTGSLQKNKVKYAVELFDMIETIDRIELAREIDKKAWNKKIKALIQINIGAEDAKSGCSEKEAVGLIKEISHLKNISIEGLMAIPPFCENPEDARPYFKRLFELSRKIAMEGIDNVSMKELSMGMSNDFEVAIEEGATMVRIGTAIFG